MKHILPHGHSQFFKWVCLLFIGLLFNYPAFSQASSRKLITKGTNGAPFGYFEYLPTGYSPTSEKKPLILYLHGAGEIGNGSSDLYKMKQRALPKLLQNGKEIPFVVIAPQASSWWHNHDLLPMLDWVKKQYNIDPARIYLTGISMGGTKAWDFAGDHPDKVTTVSPLGADARGLDPCRLSSVHVWAFHGAKDGIYPASAMTAAVDKLNTTCNPKAEPPAKGTVYSDHGHDDLWDHVYNVAHGHDLYKWMLQFKKSSTPPPTTGNKAPVANAGPDITLTLPENSTYIYGSGSDADGSISKYWWSKISGPAGKMSKITSPAMYAYDLVEGTYEFELTVTDDKGATGKDRVKLYVTKSGSNPPTTVTQGLNYKYYEGNWTVLPDFSKLQPKKTGTVTNFSLSPRSKNDLFGFVFDGYIKISTAGTYTFYTKSDDGSKLYISGQEIVNNDETHGMRERYGSIYLKAGSYPIRVTYFERWGSGEGLIVSYKGPNISKRTIPDGVLSTGSTSSSTLASTASLEGEFPTATDGVTEEAEAATSGPGLQAFTLLENPVQQGFLKLAVAEASLFSAGEVVIIDATGRRHTARLEPGSTGSGFEISTRHLNPGIYILLLHENGGKQHRTRFIQP